jgi:hypothetical protein
MIDKIFLVCAVLGGTLLLVRVVLMFFGVGDDDGGMEMDGDGDMDFDGDGDEGSSGFKLLSFQSLTAFFMMFGLVGIALHKGTGVHAVLSIGGAIAAGLLTSYIMAFLFGVFMRLQHSGTLKLKNAIGKEGKMYLGIFTPDSGKIEVVIQGRLCVYDAISADKDNIPTGARVVVTGISGGSTLIVRKS